MDIAQKKRDFCQNILYLRQKHPLTQAQMASIMGIGVHSLRRIEQGNLPPRIGARHLLRIADYFQISADCLFEPLE